MKRDDLKEGQRSSGGKPQNAGGNQRNNDRNSSERHTEVKNTNAAGLGALERNDEKLEDGKSNNSSEDRYDSIY